MHETIDGASLVIGAGGIGAAEATVAQLGDSAAAYQIDVTDEDSVAAVVEQASEAFGLVTRLVYTAGIIHTEDFLDVSPSQWRRTLEVNLTGAFLCMQAVARRLVSSQQPGRFVVVASVAGRGPRADCSDYAASKAGLISLVQSAAVSLASHNIHVNAVYPGVVDTAMTRVIHEARATAQGITVEESLASLVDRIPLGRIETPEEVSDAIWFLLSDAARYVTGQALNVCGGLAFD
jgi:NAD(P)-dependent dehydrogenase (short-subunit alcohol dehydrogenase family)